MVQRKNVCSVGITKHLNIFSNISPTAQTLQENFIVDLKDCLLADIGQQFEDLLEAVSVQREALEAEFQAGRDRLLRIQLLSSYCGARNCTSA